MTCGSSKRDGLAAGYSVAGSARVKGVGVEGQDPKTHPPAGLKRKSPRHSVPAMTHMRMSLKMSQETQDSTAPFDFNLLGLATTCRFCKGF